MNSKLLLNFIYFWVIFFVATCHGSPARGRKTTIFEFCLSEDDDDDETVKR